MMIIITTMTTKSGGVVKVLSIPSGRDHEYIAVSTISYEKS